MESHNITLLPILRQPGWRIGAMTLLMITYKLTLTASAKHRQAKTYIICTYILAYWETLREQQKIVRSFKKLFLFRF